MHYDAYLARGWQVGTGVVEGACGHLVKGRRPGAGGRAALAAADGAFRSGAQDGEELGVGEAYHKGLGVLLRLLGLALSMRTLQEQVVEDAPAVEAFYAQQAPTSAEGEAAVLVLLADGKGVLVLRPATAAPAPVPGRLGKGEKPGGKKEATLTAVYTITPTVCMPKEVAESLFLDPSAAGDAASDTGRARREREGLRHKRLWANLAGKDAVLDEAAAQVTQRDGSHIAQRVALVPWVKAHTLSRLLGQRGDLAALAKDRCRRSGMRWTIAGAEALLHLRCVQENDEWISTTPSGGSATSGSTRPPTPTTWRPRSPPRSGATRRCAALTV